MKNHSAGLAIIYNDHLLLTHATGSKWQMTFGIPKGKIDKGESVLDAAIRETAEEVGVKTKKIEFVFSKEKSIHYMNKKGKKTKKLSFFVYYITEKHLSKLVKKDTLVLKKDLLQLDEVDWAGFIHKDELKDKMLPNQYQLVSQLDF